MRRIPPSQRTIETLSASSHLIRTGFSLSPCRVALSRLPSTSAPFSTSARYNGLLDVQKDKKKHIASVRRWQKRLLGDSEPIGSRVDPYDATSPVRIRPEEQGEEEEVLEGEQAEYEYRAAKRGEGLMHVGGRNWVKKREEEAVQQMFEQLTGRPYAEHERFGRSKPIQTLDEVEDLFYKIVKSLARNPQLRLTELAGYLSESEGAQETVVSSQKAFQPKPSSPEDTTTKSAIIEEEVIVDGYSGLASSVEASEQTIAAMRQAVRKSVTTLSGNESVTVTTYTNPGPAYDDVPLTKPSTKFQLAKAIQEKTGIILTSSQLTRARTLGDIYAALRSTLEPKPTKIMDLLQYEVAREKKGEKSKPGMEVLLDLPNVKLHPRKLRIDDRETPLGRWKVIQYALAERDLPLPGEKDWAGFSIPELKQAKKENAKKKKRRKALEKWQREKEETADRLMRKIERSRLERAWVYDAKKRAEIAGVPVDV